MVWPSSGPLRVLPRASDRPWAGCEIAGGNGTVVATIVANLLGDRSLASAILFAICNSGEAVLTAWLVENQFGSGFTLGRLRHVLGLLTAAIIATAVSGSAAPQGLKY